MRVEEYGVGMILVAIGVLLTLTGWLAAIGFPILVLGFLLVSRAMGQSNSTGQ